MQYSKPFTNACIDFEQLLSTGLVLVGSDGKLRQHFFQEVHVDLLQLINVTLGTTLVFELEFFAIFCAFLKRA